MEPGKTQVWLAGYQSWFLWSYIGEFMLTTRCFAVHQPDTCDSSENTTELILQTLLTLVSYPDGAKEFVGVEDASPLLEIAPSYPLVLDVFLYAYSQPPTMVKDQPYLQSHISQTVQSLNASFKGTDAVTFLNFLDQLLRRLDPEVQP